MGVFDIITNPGDKLEARVTSTGRQVIKIVKDGAKYSAVKYPNGKIVETRTLVEGSRAAKNFLEKLHK